VAQVAYRGTDGRRHFLTRLLRDEHSAKLALPALLARVGRERELLETARTLDVFLADWLDRVAGSVSPRTLTSYRTHVARHISPLLGGIPTVDLRAVDVDRLIRDRARAGLSPATIERILTTLSMALGHAVREGTLVRNVVQAAHRPKVQRYPITALTPERARQILEVIRNDRDAVVYELLLGSGMRAGEAVGLDWRDVDLERGTVFIRAGKTPRAVRTIPIPPSVVASLRAHRNTAGTIDPRAPVFTGSRKGQRLRVDVLTHRFPTLLEEAGLPRMRLHDLRHGHATLLLAAGVAMRTISDQLGHANPAMTANVYAHVQPEALRGAVTALDDLLRSG
jgi:integrase